MEKLAKAIVGINLLQRAEDAFADKVGVRLQATKDAVRCLKLKISEPDLDALFLRNKAMKETKHPDTAREIRSRLFHDFGPTQVDHVLKHAPRLIPIMRSFIRDDIDPVLKHLRALWAAR